MSIVAGLPAVSAPILVATVAYRQEMPKRVPSIVALLEKTSAP
jgi:hypothetical protein